MKENIIKKRILSLLILILCTLVFKEVYAQGVIIGQNFRLYPSNVSQTEVFITAHPTDPNILFASANTIVFSPTFFVSEGIYVSTDAGNNWYGSDTCSGQYIDFHGGDPGIAIDKDGTFIITRLGRAPVFPGLYSHHSTDNGQTWSLQKSVSLDELERATIVSDVDPASPFYGRTYIAYVRFTPPWPVMTAHTNDGAQNWITPFAVNNPPQRSAGGEITIGLNGEVYITWAGVANQSPFIEIHGSFASSTDGGVTWNVNEVAFEMRGIVGLLPQKQNIRVNGLPRIAVDKSNSPYRGTIYIVTTERNFGAAGSDPDIILLKSTDKGASWSSGIRVNQDALNNGKIQYFPAIDVDDWGGVNIIYYDDRNTTSDSNGVFLSRSTDGGNTWNEYEISDHRFKPVPIGGLGTGYQGDNIDIVAVGNKLWPVWMDNSTGTYQIWTAPIEILTSGIDEDASTEKVFQLHQNYPNPFNPNTVISWSLAEVSQFSLKIYDVLGNELAELVNDYYPAGNYNITFDADNLNQKLSSGIYFYRLTTKNFSETKAMVLLK